MFDVSLSSKTVRLSELALRIEAARVFSSPQKLKFSGTPKEKWHKHPTGTYAMRT